jgi:hypothetical protein
VDLQKINIKIFIDVPARIRLEPFLNIFARWREDKSDPAEWIDLADYAHVANGPGVMLIGRQGNLSADLCEPGPGLLYANKSGLSGRLEDRVLETWRRGLTLVRRLHADPDYPGELQPRPGAWEITFNDRLVAPNTDETDQVLQPGVRTVARKLFGTDGFALVRQADSERRCAYSLNALNEIDLDQMTAFLKNQAF